VAVIRDVVLHMANEQPLLADLFTTPTAGDAGLVCTNVRTVDGKRPVYIDRSESVFFFPYLAIRFLEISQAAIARHIAEGGDAGAGFEAAGAWTADGGGSALVPVDEPEYRPEPPPDDDLEIDEGFLRRIRDI
jgi:hypothetical protein